MDRGEGRHGGREKFGGVRDEGLFRVCGPIGHRAAAFAVDHHRGQFVRLDLLQLARSGGAGNGERREGVWECGRRGWREIG